ncbi:MAG: hypothetical protein EOP09_05755 [Proteobacteria bacterium]|nr:MAG: hypothetical protein EOP09_05755 [Pseudomonadota bacterium]
MTSRPNNRKLNVKTAFLARFLLISLLVSTLGNEAYSSTIDQSTVLSSSERVQIVSIYPSGSEIPNEGPLKEAAARLNEEISSRLIAVFPKSVGELEIDSLRFKITVMPRLPSPFERRAALWAETDSELDAKDSVIDVYLTEAMLLLPEAAYSLTAHEIFHGVHARVNRDEETWVKEGLAQVFEWMAGQKQAISFAIFKFGFMTRPKLGINFDLSGGDESTFGGYGQSLLYFLHLYKHCGGDSLFWNLVTSPDTGITAVSSSLKEMNDHHLELIHPTKRWTCASVENHYESFLLARYLNQRRGIAPYENTLLIHGEGVAGKNFIDPALKLTVDELQRLKDGIPVFLEVDQPVNVKSLPENSIVRYIRNPFPEATAITPEFPVGFKPSLTNRLIALIYRLPFES